MALSPASDISGPATSEAALDLSSALGGDSRQPAAVYRSHRNPAPFDISAIYAPGSMQRGMTDTVNLDAGSGAAGAPEG